MTKTAADAAAAAKRSQKRKADDCVASAATGRSVDDGLRQRPSSRASSTPEPGRRSKASGPVTSGVMARLKVVGAPKPAAAPTRRRVASAGLALSTGYGCVQPAVPTTATAKATRTRSSGGSGPLATLNTSVTTTKVSSRRSEEPFSAPGATLSTASSDGNRLPIGSRQPKVAADRHIVVPDRHRRSDDDSGPAAVRRRRSSRDEFKAALPSSGRRVSRRQGGASAGRSCSSGGGGSGSKSPSGICLVAPPPLGAASDRRAAVTRQPGGLGARRSQGCNGCSSWSSSSEVAALAGAAEASAVASGSSSATGAAKGRTSKRKQMSAYVVEVDESEIVVDLCTSPALPSTAGGSISQTPLKTDRDLKELTEEDLLRMIQKNHNHLKSIMTGETPCQRHVEYGRGRKARRDLDKRVPLLLLTEEQIECIADALLQAFCGTSLERADYMLRVLLPEMLARIYMEVHSTTAAETEKLFSDMTADFSFLS